MDLNIDSNVIRTTEASIGNFLADLANTYNKTDCTIINSGSIRYGKMVKAGELWNSVFEANFDGALIIKEVPGKVLREVLEHSVSSYPN